MMMMNAENSIQSVEQLQKNQITVLAGNLDNDDDILQVTCNSIVAMLYKKKFGSGGKGKCITVDDNKWMTPIEFEQYCGKSSYRDWKRSIKCDGQQLLTLIQNNVLIHHAFSCLCSVCSNDQTTPRPIILLERRAKRKRNEIITEKENLRPSKVIINDKNDNFIRQLDILEKATDLLIQQSQNLKELLQQARFENAKITGIESLDDVTHVLKSKQTARKMTMSLNTIVEKENNPIKRLKIRNNDDDNDSNTSFELKFEYDSSDDSI